MITHGSIVRQTADEYNKQRELERVEKERALAEHRLKSAKDYLSVIEQTILSNAKEGRMYIERELPASYYTCRDLIKGILQDNGYKVSFRSLDLFQKSVLMIRIEWTV